MIVIVKNRNKNRLLVKGLSIVSLVVMFSFYYIHMSNKFKEQNEQFSKKIEKPKKDIPLTKAQKLENIIYNESVIIVNLLDQKHIQSIKVVKGSLYIVCDFTTDIEPLIVRYGVGALVKHTSKNIKIAIDLKTIVENKYEA